MQEETAYGDWKSLFTDEVRIIWQQESRELRRAAMLFYIIQKEFQRIESNLKSDISRFRGIIELIKSKSPERDKQEVSPHESPTINKHRRLNNSASSQSLLHIRKEKSAVLSERVKQKVEAVILDSSSSEPEDADAEGSKQNSVFKTPNSSKSDDDLLVDCSIVVNQMPNKKLKVEENSKWIKTKNKKKLKQPTITKMLFSGAKQRISSIDADKQKNVGADETYYAPLEKKKFSALRLITFDNYDEIPSTKRNSPQHVHKTEVVRNKAERMNLPGWSCAECEKFYESLNLTPMQLKQKMDACSKHRSKFPRDCETPQGFWDITMPETPDIPLL